MYSFVVYVSIFHLFPFLSAEIFATQKRAAKRTEKYLRNDCVLNRFACLLIICEKRKKKKNDTKQPVNGTGHIDTHSHCVPVRADEMIKNIKLTKTTKGKRADARKNVNKTYMIGGSVSGAF